MADRPKPPILTRSTRPPLAVLAPVFVGSGAHLLIRDIATSHVRLLGIAISAVFVLGGIVLGVVVMVTQRRADALLEERARAGRFLLAMVLSAVVMTTTLTLLDTDSS